MEHAADNLGRQLTELGAEFEPEAEYTLESPVRCSSCSTHVDRVHIVRLLRTRVNFTSSLPRRGYVVACPACRAVLPAVVG